MTKEYPMLFREDMVLAILRGNKTVTRRWHKNGFKKGDILWVQEPWAAAHKYDNADVEKIPRDTRVYYFAGGLKTSQKLYKRDASSMPRWASRITLRIVEDSWKQIVTDITDEDVIKEGIRRISGNNNQYLNRIVYGTDDPVTHDISPIEAFKNLWSVISTSDNWSVWSSDIEVWVHEFEMINSGKGE